MRLLRLPLPTPRNQELGLLVLAAGITGGAYALASLGRTASLPANIGTFLGAVFGLLLLAHLALRRFAPLADGTLLPVAALLNGLGFVFIARLENDLAAPQATWTGVGIAAFAATLFFVKRARDLQRYRYTFALIGLLLFVSPIVAGTNINGANNWLRFGPFSFQPGEVAKIALTIFFASYLVEKRELLSIATRRLGPMMIPDLKHFAPIFGAWLLALVVMARARDLGSALLFFSFFIVILYVATGRVVYLAFGAIMTGVGAWLAFTYFTHVQQRVTIWLDPWSDIEGDGFQIAQSMFAMGSGGVTGSGLGLGDPNKIPIVYTDFIFAAIGEELGALGTIAVLIAFMTLIGVGFRIALKATNQFEKLLATGLTAVIGLQSFIIIGGVIRVIPLTGITLPFVSYGGSSLVTNYVLLALLLRISHQHEADVVERGADSETRLVNT